VKSKLPPPHRSARVGFYACSGSTLARIVQVELAEGVEHPPRTPTLLCPVCGNEHQVAITWRKRTGLDQGREAELVVGP
jgi:hypothetical protein